MSETYAFNDIEARWQREWEQRQSFRAAQPGEPGGDRPKYYVLDFFPYPSGAGLHVGHPLGYIASDIIARFMRMRGHNVLHPMGWDAFGLPAEQYAVETGVHPAITTRKNIETYTRQLKLVGLSYDWTREISTCEPDYYHWTQWIFLQIYNAWYDPEFRWTDATGRAVKGKARHIRELPIPEDVRARGAAAIEEFQADHRLAFLAEIPVNWCPALGTVLANEEVTADGRSERGNHPVFRRPMKQWILRITEYADRLLSDLDPLDWPEPIKLMQRNWIGRSEGAYVDFRLTNADGKPSENVIRVFTTRPDTLYGATYLVLAPEHHLVEMITTPEHREPVHAYVQLAKQKSDLDRTADAKGKSGVFTGAHAINPVTGGRVPVWVADYVLAGYGTGSIMAVPAHDTRDFDFAKTHQLPIRDVIYPHAIAAMKYFSEHAQPAEQADHVWVERLADFLGLVGAQDATADQYAAALRNVRERREADRTPSHAAERDIAGVLGQEHVQRGVIKMTWVEALENLEFANFEDFRKPFLSGGFYARRGSAYTEEGTCVNCKSAWADFDWIRSPEMKKAIVAKLAADGLGEATIQYKLRDWLFSRQRYWGEPFPILYHEDGRITAEQEANLPVTLPQMEDFKPTASDDPNAEPQTPLSRAKEWVTVRRDGQTLRRELNTMPQWAGSCWYYIRFCDPQNSNAFIQQRNEKYWLGDTKTESGAPAIGGVDLYMGGAEHAVLHLLYARFWHKMLYDLGHVSTPEPFQKLFNQGMIGADSYRDERGVYAPADQIVEGPEAEMPHPEQVDPRRFAELMRTGLNEIEAERGARVRVKTTYFHDGRPVFKTFDKMSKTKKNVVNPDDIIREYGADTLRLYEMYMGPLEASKPWNTRDIIGVHRFLQRVWRLVIEGIVSGARDENASAAGRGRDDGAPWRINSKIGAERNDAIERLLHKTIKKIGHDIPKFMFNTSIAQMIVFVNEAQKAESIGRDQVERFLHVLSPFAPHIAEELWSRLGHAEPLAGAAWPTFDEALTRDDTIEIAVQVNGKVRGRVSIVADADDAAMIAAARELENVQREIGSRNVKRSICVKGRLVNLIVG